MILLLLTVLQADAKALYQRAQADYDAGRFDEAAREFRASYDLSHAPALLYNLGQTYRLQGKCSEALAAYESYLRELPGAKNHAVAERQRDEVRKCAASDEIKKAPESIRKESSAPRSAPINTRISTVTPEPRLVETPPAERPSRAPALVLGLSGAAAALVGGLLVSHAGGEFDRLQMTCGTRCPPSSWDGLGAAEKTGWALVAVGGLAAAGGVGLWLWEGRATVVPTGRGVALAGRF